MHGGPKSTATVLLQPSWTETSAACMANSRHDSTLEGVTAAAHTQRWEFCLPQLNPRERAKSSSLARRFSGQLSSASYFIGAAVQQRKTWAWEFGDTFLLPIYIRKRKEQIPAILNSPYEGGHHPAPSCSTSRLQGELRQVPNLTVD